MAMATAPTKFKPSDFINRELSWLEFNQRVLEEALDGRNPLLERVKFFCIVSTNLDEFFEIRVAGLKQAMESRTGQRGLDGRTPSETFRAVTQRVRRLVRDQYECWREHLLPLLARHDIRILAVEDLEPVDRDWLEAYYRTQVRPVLTPLALASSHPFPHLTNKSVYILAEVSGPVRGRKRRSLAVVQVPRGLPRLVALPREDGRREYVLLGNLISNHLGNLFPGMEVLGYWFLRVTRNSDLYIDEEESANLLTAVEREVHNRRKGDAVRLELAGGCPVSVRDFLLRTLRLGEEDIYEIDGPLQPQGIMSIYDGDHSSELREPPHVAPRPAGIKENSDLFALIRERAILLHHPYESFEVVIDFLEQAAADPHVLAIKQTLYRTGSDSRILAALRKAVYQGKQVTVVVELKARFDEEANIRWSRQLEEAGVHVVYGLVGMKVHGKIVLVVRSEGDRIRRYVHLSTGNYNPSTARLYTDIGYLTCQPDFGEDATNLFNLLTGICQYQGMAKLVPAPFELKGWILAKIEREATHARQRLPARIIAKMNALADREVIEALYRAAAAGVEIDLIVRGICCLRAQVPRLSKRIRVRSIVDRFLEHSRVFYFENACRPEVFLGSADWMPRNLERRIEIVFPVEDGVLRDRLVHEVLGLSLGDNEKARALQADNTYRRVRVRRGDPSLRSQEEFMRLARGELSRRPALETATDVPRVVVRTEPLARPSEP